MSLAGLVRIPRELSKPSVWFKRFDQDDTGRRNRAWAEQTTGRASVAAVEATERLKWGQLGHPVSHNVVYDRNIPTALPGDYFLINGKRFYVEAVEDPGELGIVVLFKCREHPDRDD